MNLKKFCSFIILVVIEISVVFAGPFGLEMGMTLEEVQEVCDGEVYAISGQEDMYEICPEKKHSSFNDYSVFIDKKYGLYGVCAITENISSDNYGTEIKEKFYAIVSSLSSKYGKPYVLDELVDDETSYYSDAKNWLYTMKNGSRKLEAYWEMSRDGVKLLDNLSSIKLLTVCDYSGSRIMLVYIFKNNYERAAEEDSYL